ncbi:GDP-L-fucose synthase [Tardiphaga sp. OK246]|uniref:GDP-L-fucose synthase family protein n=1 Tax=Tardiphaga sp. OK246 TaxID=1855307 RepID=UPI000B73BF4A|nr:GDP-L-fucose synthase [Tardiphaga sp. OK246]SNT63913.1 GDP-L-fucose synthase [Tardiphaga sp. OK246]
MSLFDYDLSRKKVFVAGHRGMVGSAIVRRLATEDCEVLIAERNDADLLNSEQTRKWLERHRPDAVVLAAAKVGGIGANNALPVDFLCENMRIQLNVIQASHAVGVDRLLFLGSSCIYPKLAKQPINEDALLTGPLEPTNEWYAIAKIAGLKMCQAYRQQFGRDYISAMPTNLYGPGDNYHPDHSHVPAALLRRFHEAKLANAPSVSVWGTGMPLREFLYVDDMADACVFLLKHYSEREPINVGTGEEISIGQFAAMVAGAVGFRGKLEFDTSKPDGTPRKLLDSSRILSLGWKPRTSLQEGLPKALADFLNGGGRHLHVASAAAE